ncbi:MAG: sigma-54-dependent Fis family transcriptional regulator [Bradymonadales bacterium]|nr:sigma-54-dependent Fis family transcriptional regulator [Bradymonadales bacterium]
MKTGEIKSTERVLLYAEDDAAQRQVLSGFLRGLGWTVIEAANAADAVAKARWHEGSIDLLLTDLRLGGPDGVTLLKQLRAIDPALQGIVVTAFGQVDDAVRAMRAGAYDFLIKPIDLRRLELLLERALEQVSLARERSVLVEATGLGLGLPDVVGTSPAMVKVAQLARRIASAAAPIMILGESGAGKEVLARAIHAISSRRDGPFVVLNCAALPESLVESELFGHEKGAFTGADRARQGRFQRAEGGTLLLDEVGDIPLAVQVKLLNVLHSGVFEPVGSSRSLKADVRLISATHRNLAELVAQGRFREDLYYRIGVFTIAVPPLRERPEDIPLLARHFMRLAAESMGREDWKLTEQAEQWLLAQPFRGNVRELRNVIERALVFADEDRLDLEHFELGSQMRFDLPAEGGTAPDRDPIVLDDSYQGIDSELARLESRRIQQALALSQGNKSAAARLLKTSERAIRYKLKKYGLDPD